MAADQGLIDSVANSNTKTVAEASAYAMAQIFQQVALNFSEASASSNRRSAMADAAMGQVLKKMGEVDITEAIAIAKAVPSDLSGQLAQLGAVIAQVQQVVKTAQTTPPPTTATGV
jgi:hypothetical protein